MPALNFPIPLTRQNPWYPGVFGIIGSWNELGMRTDSNASVFYVDLNNDDPNDSNDGTDPLHPLSTIQAAVDKCESYKGDVILVSDNAAWTYGPGTPRGTIITESVIVDVAGVSIIGVSPAGSLGVPWRPATVSRIACDIQAMNVMVAGFCFMGCAAGAGGTAIRLNWTGAAAGWGENAIICDNFFDNTVDDGVLLVYSWNNKIMRNEFQECDLSGIYCDPAGSAPEFNIIEDNVFTNVGTAAGPGAIALSEGENNTIRRNVIFNQDAQSGAAATNEGINTSAGGGGNMVYDNTFSCLLPTGVPASGDWDDLNSADALDAWVNNHLLDGNNVTNPT